MKYAILSDIHANVSALRRVLDDARALGAEKFVCLGDVVGYGPQPKAAVALVRSACDIVLAGNHDAAVAGHLDTADFIDLAEDAVDRHRAALSRKDLAWLRSLPPVCATDDFSAAHGDFTDPDRFSYVDGEAVAAENFHATRGQLLFVGHTHVPRLFLTGASGKVYSLEPTDFVLEDGKRYLVNPGSVGYPRECNGVCRSSYVLYDTSTRTVSFRFLPFEVASVLQRGKSSRVRRRLLLAALAAALGLAGFFAFFALRPSPPPAIVHKEDPLVLQTKTYAVAADIRTLRPNLWLAKGSSPLSLRTVFRDADNRTLGTETISVRQSRTKAVPLPAGTVSAEITLLRQNAGDTPRIRSFTPSFER